MGLSFSVRAADIDEAMEPGKDPAQEVARVSRAKAMAAPAGPQDVVIAADTIVVCGGRILGKPGTEERAAEMLRLLSGRDHQVMTGFTVRRGSTVLTQTEVSHIFFRPLDEGEIDAYVATGEPLDKAGAYGIQGLAALFVTRLEGILQRHGPSLCALAQQLRKLGVRILGGVRGCEETFEFQSESGPGSDGGPGCGLGPHRGLRPPEGSPDHPDASASRRHRPDPPGPEAV
ncbi:MAG: Maf family protein [Oscillospiraceae bacterium]